MALHFNFPRKIITCVLMASSLLGASMSQAATTIRLGWTTADSAVDPYAITAHYFQEELEAAAPGQFKVRFFPSNQLGNDTEMLQGMQFGTLDAGVITGTQLGTLDSSFQVNDLPFLFKDSQQAHRVLDGELGAELFARLEKQGIVGLGFAEAGFRHTINNKRAVEQPADLTGVKLRVQPSDLYIASFRALGANPIPMAWSDAFTAVQQGTVDGLEIPLAVIYANKYAGAVKYLSLTNHTYNALPLLISKQIMSRLPADQQEVVRSAARKAIERQRETVAQNEEALIEKIKAEGMAINDVTDPQAFRDAVKPVYDQYRDRIGSDVLDRALKLVSE
ncbi:MULTISPECIES: TRAP transporter substrate-binding protein [Stutzerimonas stutzeri subgroup]|jgi:tripartite ATP-independent transporter DctP family solute receptor|uniref:TRAP transporter substrate-binding protein n=1 Tax=Stutzerimonas stutzeri subgroup TaxID=578833 RepID=UPI00066ECB7A|nr:MULTISPECIES: TRAP transporter substrate-binding protein [Stutzerimonas stutzeri subgroup]WOF80860.1 TRAP transporter substrate-binding protein [Pseudomonas sp. FeN3W]